LLEAEVVETLADGHGADGIASLDADFAGFVREGWGTRFLADLEDDFVADALDYRVD